MKKLKNLDKTFKLKINHDSLTRLIKYKISKKKQLMVKAQSGDCNAYLANCCSCCDGGCWCDCTYIVIDPLTQHWECIMVGSCPPGYILDYCEEPAYPGQPNEKGVGLCKCVLNPNPIP